MSTKQIKWRSFYLFFKETIQSRLIFSAVISWLRRKTYIFSLWVNILLFPKDYVHPCIKYKVMFYHTGHTYTIDFIDSSGLPTGEIIFNNYVVAS